MAFYNPNAALQAQKGVDSLRINGAWLTAELIDALTSVSISRDITQASTLTVSVSDKNRVLLNSALCTQGSTVTVGALTFTLVQVSKAGNVITLTFEDALINRLRQVKGAMSQAAGVQTRVQFAAQLCLSTFTPFIGDFDEPLAQEPLTRGTTDAPDEDTWTCLTRLAGDVGWRCFSDGTSVVFGPDSWLLSPFGFGLPVMGCAEYTAGIDTIDFDWDVGKPTAQATVKGIADGWTADPGGCVALAGVGPANALWVTKTIARDLNKRALTVTLVSPQPTLPEPTPDATETATTTGG